MFVKENNCILKFKLHLKFILSLKIRLSQIFDYDISAIFLVTMTISPIEILNMK